MAVAQGRAGRSPGQDADRLQRVDDRPYAVGSRRGESGVSLLTIRTGLVPPTINYRNPDPDIPMDVVPNEARRASIRSVLSSSFGFGGQNASLILAAP